MSDFCIGAYSSAAISRANYIAAVARNYEGRPRQVRALKEERRSVAIKRAMDTRAYEQAEARIIANVEAGKIETFEKRSAEKKKRASLESLCREWNAHTFWVLAVALIFPPVALLAIFFLFFQGLFLDARKMGKT